MLSRKFCLRCYTKAGYDVSLGFIAFNSLREVNWSDAKSSWYTYDSDVWLFSRIAESFKSGPKAQNDFAVLVDRKLSKLPVVFLKVSRFPCLGQSRKIVNSWPLGILLTLKNLWWRLLRKRQVSKCSPVTRKLKLIGTWLTGRQSRFKSSNPYPWRL